MGGVPEVPEAHRELGHTDTGFALYTAFALTKPLVPAPPAWKQVLLVRLTHRHPCHVYGLVERHTDTIVGLF